VKKLEVNACEDCAELMMVSTQPEKDDDEQMLMQTKSPVLAGSSSSSSSTGCSHEIVRECSKFLKSIMIALTEKAHIAGSFFQFPTSACCGNKIACDDRLIDDADVVEEDVAAISARGN